MFSDSDHNDVDAPKVTFPQKRQRKINPNIQSSSKGIKKNKAEDDSSSDESKVSNHKIIHNIDSRIIYINSLYF